MGRRLKRSVTLKRLKGLLEEKHKDLSIEKVESICFTVRADLNGCSHQTDDLSVMETKNREQETRNIYVSRLNVALLTEMVEQGLSGWAHVKKELGVGKVTCSIGDETGLHYEDVDVAPTGDGEIYDWAKKHVARAMTKVSP